MRRPLHLHPSSASPVQRVEVEMERRGRAVLALAWFVSGDLERLRLPPPATPRRRDGLWQHSCFELFLRSGAGEGYDEFNLAPSGEWAAYRFTGYRRGMSRLDLPAPRIELRQAAGKLSATAELHLPEDAAAQTWRVGAAAVLEDVRGGLSYWALAHPPGRPDFHHPDCLAVELPAP